MTLDVVHPDLDAEQAYVDYAYSCMATMLSDVSSFGPHGRNDFEREAFERWQQARIAALSDTTSALVFGRIDHAADETFYIGRHHIRDTGYGEVVVDWRAPVAKTFYQANAREPMGLRLRRQFLVEGREILGIADDHLEDASSGDERVRGREILHHELARQRGPHMRDIVATIQAEQDVIIRAPLEGIVVVQGGPGTGKTAIGLHRAAFLLYEHRATLQRRGVLVAGPNPVFIRYVSQVLPSLGESALTQVAVNDLVAGVRIREEEPPDVARLKGDARMSVVVRRAIDERCGTAEHDLELAVEGVRFTLTAEEIGTEAARLRARSTPHRDGRERIRDALLVQAWRAYEAALSGGVSLPFEDVTARVRKDPGFRRTLDRVWPALTPTRLVADLLTSPTRLRKAGDGLLTPTERRSLRRRRARAGDEPWTDPDRPLVDEARTLIDGPPDRYGHVVVDEAQDLSPMQLRMLARRCPEGSMTILGDLGQATGVWAHNSWEETFEHLPSEAETRVEELTLGYRITGAVTDLAARILRETAPHLRPPVSVRRERGEVSILEADEETRSSVAGTEALAATTEIGSIAVIVPDALVPETRDAFAASGLPYGEAETHGLGRPISVVRAARCKGLEFDGVVLIEPGRIAAEGGLRLLYVAVTRAMRKLVIVHAEPLPPPLVAEDAHAASG